MFPIDIPVYDPVEDESNAIRVIPPSDPRRLKFITIVASFVAKDGSILEKKLFEREGNNPKFSFLRPSSSISTSTWALLRSRHGPDSSSNSVSDTRGHEDDAIRLLQEHIFYRWRVFAFAQGDGFDSWRTEPFVMIHTSTGSSATTASNYPPERTFWIPPHVQDTDAARREEELVQQKEQFIFMQQEVRRKLTDKKDFMTGRQLEHAKFGKIGISSLGSGNSAADGAIQLNDSEMEDWKDIVQNRLCASRESICEAMAFCFDKSAAAVQISELLREAMLDDRMGISVETRIARLYLLSDVLFNSQQPGVKNAHRYRASIEAMAPDVFASLGKHGHGTVGRMTMNKLRNAVSAVLSAWTNWSVYNTTFLDELEFHFEGGKKKQEDVFEITQQSVDVLEPSVTEGVGASNDLTSTAIESDIDGEELCDDDLDGEELDDDDLIDVDGEPL